MKNKPYKKMYDALKAQGLTDKEIAESCVIPEDQTPEELEKSHKEFSKFLKEYRKRFN